MISFVGRAGKFRFLYDGTRINDDDTPSTLEMEDNGQHLYAFCKFFLSFLIGSIFENLPF